jgi:signal transduction histidine kinase
MNANEISILLVDDDANNLLALESILESPDHRLVRAQTAEEALLAVMEGEYAAIVLDVQMPDMNGIELARLIKQRKRSQHIPIIFLTAHYRENEHAVLGYDVGAVDYLTKPVHPGILRSKVSVFVDLFRKTRALAEMNAELEAKNQALELQAEDRVRRIRAEAAQAEAEAANAAKDRFLAMLSHELRTPLSPVLHAVTLLDEQPACIPDMRAALNIIRRNVQLEARLIDDLLDLARVRNGKLKLHFKPSDAHDLLNHALEICRHKIEQRRLHVETRFDARSSMVMADPARIQQIFWNLINNAVKFTPEEGRISISTRNDETQKSWRLEITDTGIGIASTKLGSIFDAFKQAAPGGPAARGASASA